MSHKPKPGSRKRKPVEKPQAVRAAGRGAELPQFAGGLSAEFRPALLRRIKGERPNQIAYLKAMASSTITFGLGASGTGKSFMAMGHAAQELSAGRVSRIVLSRPLVQCGGENIGFLPGDIREKTSPFMAPVLDALESFFSMADIDRLMELDLLRITPLELMRGSSFKDAIVVIDEAQNMSRIQIEMALTRVDHGTRLVFTGDQRQSDVGVSPLVEAVRQLTTPTMVSGLSVIRFTREDNMRSPIVAACAERLGI